MALESEEKMDSTIGLILRLGVVSSFALICAGCLLLFAEGNTGYYSVTTTASQLFDRRNRALIGLAPLFQGVLAVKSYAVIDLGIVVLLATPLARVAASIPFFAAEGRLRYVAIACALLVILLFSAFVVAPLVSLQQ